MHHHTDRMVHTLALVAPVVEHWLEREMDPLCEIVLMTHCTMSALRGTMSRPFQTNDVVLNGSTLWDRSDDPLHHE